MTLPSKYLNIFFTVTSYLSISRPKITNKSVLLAEKPGKSPKIRSGQDLGIYIGVLNF